jgi:hypothetical protein
MKEGTDNLKSYDGDSDIEEEVVVDDNGEEYIEEVVEDDDNDDDDSDFDDESSASSEYTTVTVETTRTKENENKKPTVPSIFGWGSGGAASKKTKEKNTQVFVPNEKPAEILNSACNDITKLTIYMKGVTVDEDVASSFLTLMRGDNRSWEAIAVDILRQKARWDSIVLEECTEAVVCKNRTDDGTHDSSGNEAKGQIENGSVSKNTETMAYLDVLISHILCVDDCGFLHLSNQVLTQQTAWSMQALTFSKSLTKLQLDLIDLNSFAVPMLIRGLRHNKSLKGLIMSRCGLLDDNLGDLLANLPKQLEELRIFGNSCRTKGLSSLTNALSQKDTRLRLLDLSYQHVSPEEVASKKFNLKPFAEVLAKNKSLKILDLDNTSINDEQLDYIIAALCKNRTLEEIMLNHNQISGAGVALLASKMKQMKGLKKVSMYSNAWTD